MNSAPHNPPPSESALSPAEQTLRLIASLPAPEGLENRIHTALSAAQSRGRVLAWPRINLDSDWMRTAAAVAIVGFVVGGGWGVYQTTQRGSSSPMVAAPARVSVSAGFSNAGAIRTPQTLPGPVLTPSAATKPAPNPAQPESEKKPAVHSNREETGKLPAHPIQPPVVNK